ncbi:unnamed protein product [Staurois parvus]|uniref:Uncharacterized protein n=1 Tax=Staurois parvus TaxID=386267 RepID=A0ABN9CG67_9NEOB|nr:unnamed protein product [Staurois parvus]
MPNADRTLPTALQLPKCSALNFKPHFVSRTSQCRKHLWKPGLSGGRA